MLYGNFPLGTIIIFRYPKPTVHDFRPTVMVLSQNWKGKLHGLNIRYMSPYEQQAVQWYFKSWARKQFGPDPFQQILDDYKKQIDEYEKRRNEFLQKQTGVIVKPTIMAGSPLQIKTFGKTPIQPQPANINSPFQSIPSPITPQNPFAEKIKGYLQQKAQGLVQDVRAKIPRDPISFYHGQLKPLFGRDIERFYRTYDIQYIQNARILHKVALF